MHQGPVLQLGNHLRRRTVPGESVTMCGSPEPPLQQSDRAVLCGRSSISRAIVIQPFRADTLQHGLGYPFMRTCAMYDKNPNNNNNKNNKNNNNNNSSNSNSNNNGNSNRKKNTTQQQL